MKRTFTTLFILCVITAASFAQNAIPGNLTQARKPANVPERHHGATVRGEQFYLDLDYSDLLFYGGDVDPDAYQYFAWNLNNRYKTTEGDTNWTYAMVGFDRLYDYNTAIEYDNDDVQSITIDSVFINLGHENNSATFDTLIVKIIKLNSAGYPQTTSSATLWADTIVMDYGLTTDWLSIATLPLEVNFTTTEKRFGVRVDYYDPSKLDTFGLIAGYGYAGDCGTSPFKAYQSTFYPNSYMFWMAYDVMVPTSTGGDVYYDCNNSGYYEEGTDGESFIQNWSIWTLVNIELVTGINDEFGAVGELYVSPNPASDEAKLSFTMKDNDDVKMELYDLSGRKIQNVFEGTLMKGEHQRTVDVSDLAAGMYMLKVQSGSQKISKRLVVSE